MKSICRIPCSGCTWIHLVFSFNIFFCQKYCICNFVIGWKLWIIFVSEFDTIVRGGEIEILLAFIIIVFVSVMDMINSQQIGRTRISNALVFVLGSSIESKRFSHCIALKDADYIDLMWHFSGYLSISRVRVSLSIFCALWLFAFSGPSMFSWSSHLYFWQTRIFLCYNDSSSIIRSKDLGFRLRHATMIQMDVYWSIFPLIAVDRSSWTAV